MCECVRWCVVLCFLLLFASLFCLLQSAELGNFPIFSSRMYCLVTTGNIWNNSLLRIDVFFSFILSFWCVSNLIFSWFWVHANIISCRKDLFVCLFVCFDFLSKQSMKVLRRQQRACITRSGQWINLIWHAKFYELFIMYAVSSSQNDDDHWWKTVGRPPLFQDKFLFLILP